MGGIVASALAVRHPELVAGLVLVDPKYSSPDDVVDRALDAIRGPSPAVTAAAIFGQSFYTPDTPEFLKAWHRRRVLATPDHVVTGCLLGMYEGDEGIGRASIAQDYLRQRTASRLAVYAAEPATWLERALPHGEADEIHVVPGSHFMHQQLAGQLSATYAAAIRGWPPGQSVRRPRGPFRVAPAGKGRPAARQSRGVSGNMHLCFRRGARAQEMPAAYHGRRR
jgi:pimeloyl-ACP methyl ester carboxylesterase